jgi:drug/metabolite transporter (DMT)-like permease
VPAAHSERFKADLILLLTAVLWGSAFAVQRVAAAEMSAFAFNGARYLIGALVLLPFLRLKTFSTASKPDRKTWLGMILLGLFLFSGALLQQAGLKFTTAGNAGFITGLYVILVPMILALGWQRLPRPIIWIASLLAVAGLFLLSTGGRFRLSLGDALELAGAFLWSFHVLLLSWLVKRVNVIQLSIVQNLVTGLLSLSIALAYGPSALDGLAGSWWTVVYTGVFSIGIGYTLQAVGQKVAPPADAAILLSGESVFAALFGWIFLAEYLKGIQLLGCGLMLAGMLLAQTGDRKETEPVGYIKRKRV